MCCNRKKQEKSILDHNHSGWDKSTCVARCSPTRKDRWSFFPLTSKLKQYKKVRWDRKWKEAMPRFMYPVSGGVDIIFYRLHFKKEKAQVLLETACNSQVLRNLNCIIKLGNRFEFSPKSIFESGHHPVKKIVKINSKVSIVIPWSIDYYICLVKYLELTYYANWLEVDFPCSSSKRLFKIQ